MAPGAFVGWQLPSTANEMSGVAQLTSEKKLMRAFVQLALPPQVHELQLRETSVPTSLRALQPAGQDRSPSRPMHAEEPAGTRPLQTSSWQELGASQTRCSVEVTLVVSVTVEAVQAPPG